MKRYVSSLLLAVILLLAGAIPALAHGGEEAAFNAETSVKQAIVALVQPQPNVGVIEMKLMEVIEKKDAVEGVDIAKVEEAQQLVKAEKYEEAELLLFESIALDPAGEDALLGSPLVEYEKEFSPDQATYLLLASAIVFVAIGGLILKQTVRG